MYDPQTDRWQSLADMESARDSVAAAAAGGKIYAIGGQDFEDEIKHEPQRSVQRTEGNPGMVRRGSAVPGTGSVLFARNPEFKGPAGAR